MRRLCAAFAVLACLACWGCAKETSAPPAPPSNPTPTSALSDAAPPAMADAPDAAPGGGAASAAATTPEPPAEPDKCAPVAAAYEKSLRGKLKQCWSDAANKSKDRIVGSIRLILEIDGSGKVVGQRMAEKSDLPEPIQKCMMRAFKAEPIDSAKCDMKTFTIAEKFPR